MGKYVGTLRWTREASDESAVVRVGSVARACIDSNVSDRPRKGLRRAVDPEEGVVDKCGRPPSYCWAVVVVVRYLASWVG